MADWLTGPWVVDSVAAGWLLLGVAIIFRGWWGGADSGSHIAPSAATTCAGNPLTPGTGSALSGVRIPGADREQVFRPPHAVLKRWSAVALALILFLAPASLVLYTVTGWQREHAVVAAVEARHAGVRLGCQPRGIGPVWLSSRLPANLTRYGHRLDGVNGYAGPWDDTDLAHLSGLKSLKLLDLFGTQVTDAGLAHLSGLTSLQWLRLSGPRVTDAGWLISSG